MDNETSVREPFTRNLSSNSNAPQKSNPAAPATAPQAESQSSPQTQSPPQTQSQPQPKKPNELHHFLADIEDLVKEATSLTGEELHQVRLKINANLASAREALEKMGTDISEKAKSGAASTNEYVHQRPWVAVGVSAAGGLLAGLLLARSRH